MCANKTAPKRPTTPIPMIPLEQAKTFEFPEDYVTNTVCDGYLGKGKEDKDTIFIQKIHLVTPSGRMACQCEIDPKKAHIFFNVDAPLEYRYLVCDEGMNYLRREAWRIINHPTPVSKGE